MESHFEARSVGVRAKRGGCVCEELGSKQLTRRSKVAIAAQLSLCL